MQQSRSLLKAALLAGAATLAAARSLPTDAGARQLKEHDYGFDYGESLASITTVAEYQLWARQYVREQLGHDALTNIDSGGEEVEYANDYITEGGNDLYDEGNELQIYGWDSRTWSDKIPYTRQTGPNANALVTKVLTPASDSIQYLATMSYSIFVGLFKMTDGSNFRGFMVGGEMGSTSDKYAKTYGTVAFAGMDYEYFGVFRKDNADDGKVDFVVTNSPSGGVHLLGAKGTSKDYDYHRVLDWSDGFSQIGYGLFGIWENTVIDSDFLDNLDSLIQPMVFNMIALMKNML